MMQRTAGSQSMSRRGVLAGSAGLIGAATLASGAARAQQNANLGAPATVISNPPRDWTPQHPSIYPDPDVIVVDPSFNQVRRAIAPIQRVWTGALWAEGPTWSSQGQYLVFSDVAGNTVYRYIWDDGRVTVFRRPSGNTNGNAFDFRGRLLSCEDFTRRLVRWEHDGTMTVIADSFDGKPLNSPNGVAPHPDGSIWFTDPGYGDQLAEGHPDEAGGERVIYAFDLQGTKLTNKRLFTDMTVDGVKCGPDDMCADVFGNLWCSSNGPLGYAGVRVFNPAGKLIGRIRLPDVCANLTFGGPKRDRLFMAASQSLYMLEVATQGAAPG